MILGIGSDLIDIRRIEKTLVRYGDRFTRRVFTEIERSKAEKRKGERHGHGRAATYAKRFAAKEACAKALGLGIARGVSWRDIGVVNKPTGEPTVILSGRALERLKALTPSGQKAHIHLTLTDEYPLAQAFVIISAVNL